MLLKHLIIFAAVATLSAGAFAQPSFHHEPVAREAEYRIHRTDARVQIERRLERQSQRIFVKLRAGTITGKQAAVLRAEDNQVRAMLRAMEERNNGRLTAQDVVELNRRLDRTSRRIGA